MSNANQSSESPASMSAAELRRRLMASTPPPMSGLASNQELETAAAAPIPRGLDAISRLKMPGNVPAVPIAQVDEVPEIPPQASIRRTQPSSRASAELGGYGVPSDAGTGSGAVKMPPPRPVAPLPDAPPPPRREDGHPSSSQPNPEVQRLKSENKELRQLLGEMKQLLQEASDNEQQVASREQEYITNLAEKQRQIETLTSQLQGIEEQIASGGLTGQPAQPKTRTELEDWADELEKDQAKIAQERRRMDEDRRQLREDEESLEKQMRDMEVSMARERAIMARQETELKRLSAEIQHELELLQRGDPALREQMQKFQRRAADVMAGRPGSNGGSQPGSRR
jgi:hypothetical protein